MKNIAAAAAAAIANRFSWFTVFFLTEFPRLEVVRVVRILVIHRHGPTILERERHDAARVRTVARRGVADLHRVADLENTRHAVRTQRLRTRARDFPVLRRAVCLLDREEP